MHQSQNLNNKTLVQLLERLGNKQPNDFQIELIGSLLLRSCIDQQIYFHPKLTARERSCLLFAAKGKTVVESAKLLNVKISTVRSWRNSILAKLKCRSIAEAIFRGIQYGYLPPTLIDAT